MKQRIKLGISTVLFFVFCSLCLTSIAQDYQRAIQQSQQYQQDKGSSAIYDEPLYVTGEDTDSHGRSEPDYFLELREMGGRLRRVGIPSSGFWTSVVQGDVCTGEIWRDKVRLVTDHGQSQQTTTNPDYHVQDQRKKLLIWGAIGMFIAMGLIYSNWILYKPQSSSELQ